MSLPVQELRQRSTGSSTTMKKPSEEIDEVILGQGLSATNMLEASPSQHGVVFKLHIPVIFGLLPTSLQNLVMSWNCLSWLMPQWRQRYLILLGKFLYKFKNKTATTPKGTPISLESIDSHLLTAPQEDDMAPAFANMPPGYNAIFTLSTFGKKHYHVVSSREEAVSWVNSLRQHRQESITRSLGHAGNMPYPKAWAYFDSLAKGLQKSKERIKQKVQRHNMREMELSAISGGGVGVQGGGGIYG